MCSCWFTKQGSKKLVSLGIKTRTKNATILQKNLIRDNNFVLYDKPCSFNRIGQAGLIYVKPHIF